MGGMDLSYRPSGVVVLGIFMIIFSAISAFFGVLQLLSFSTVSTFYLFSSFSFSMSSILTFAASGMLLLGAVGMLSMKSWGYYTAIVSSIILIAESALLFFIGFSFSIITIFGSVLGIIIIVYLFGDVKYEYLESYEYPPRRYEYPERKKKDFAKVVSVPEPIPAPIKPKPECLYCGTQIPRDAEYCPRCGGARARCPLCQKDIVSGDRYVKCPHCGVFSHRDHLLEWVKVKGTCPKCKRRLKETDIT